MAAPILLVEDNPDEALLLKRAFKAAAVPVPVIVLGDAPSTIRYLSGAGDYADRHTYPLPQLVLLDLKLPGTSGLGVLEWVRRQELLRRVPVIVFTSSTESRDIANAYDLGANSYLVKPIGTAALGILAKRVQEYWLDLNVRPELALPQAVRESDAP